MSDEAEQELTDPAPVGGFGLRDGKFHVTPGTAAEHEWGIQYQGPFESATDGTARAVRQHARALNSAGVPVLLQSYSNAFIDENGVLVGSEAMDEKTKAEVHDLRYQSIGELRLRIKHLVVKDATQLRGIIIPPSVGMDQDVERAVAVRDRLYKTTIVYSVWERTTIAPAVASILARVGENWVPCEENAEMLRKHGVERVVVVPHPWDPSSDMAKLVRRKPKSVTGKRFYAIGAWQPRKHYHETIGAFLLAFRPSDAASLTIKTSRHELPDYPSPRASRAIWLRDPRVQANGWTFENVDQKLIIVTRTVPADQLVRLHFTSNIYVCCSRGEAYALPAFDAKIAGNRMIYVSYGGMRDFADPLSDVVVPHEMKPVPSVYGWEEGALWAEAKVEDIAEAMKRVEAPPSYERSFALAGSTMDAVGKLMKERALAVLKRAEAG